MVNITFIRHGVKEYDNNKGPKGSFQHDPDIYDFKDSIVFDLYRKNKFTQIISSPYKRTRNTAMKIKDVLAKNNIYVDLIIEPIISEYLGNQTPIGEYANVEPETFSYFKPKLGIENIQKLKSRLHKFKRKILKSKTNTLVITHGINVCFLYQFLCNKPPKTIKELKGFTYKIEK